MIEIEIDGQTLPAEPGETIIQVADKAGIYIPRFCYHKKLSVVASCRMCLVDVEKAPKTLPACATPVALGMKVNTRSEKALFSQKTVMEFLLINHPLDCPICDQGGECELQDLSLGYGKGISRFTEGKRAVHDENLGPLISTEMTRCIQCTRCVRFGDEVAGVRELGAMGRGEDLTIATYIENAVHSELSGNIIDVCPVGALTSKPYRFTARAWELRQHAAIAPHDCLGSNIYIHTRGEEYSTARHVMRVVPRENETINETWISDRDRFSYEAINSPNRLLTPLLKQNGEWQAVSWDVALSEVTKRLQTTVQKSGADQIGALVSPSATVEECYLLQKLMRGLGSHNIDHRLRQSDFRHSGQCLPYPSLGLPIADLDQLNSVLLIGSNVRSEQPMANQRIRKATQRGACVLCVNPIDYAFNFPVAQKYIVDTDEFVSTLAKILKALSLRIPAESVDAKLSAFLALIEPSEKETAMADMLLAGKNGAVILGAYAMQHPDAAVIQLFAHHIAQYAGASFGMLTEGANSAGAWLAGAVPTSSGRNAREMFEQPLRAYVLLGVEPELDSAYPAAALQALQQADLVIACTAFKNKAMEGYADIILPIATFAETAGTYVNIEGKWQSMEAAMLPQGEARAAWEIFCQLGCLLAPGFEYSCTESICEDLRETLASRSTVVVDVDSYPLSLWEKASVILDTEPLEKSEGISSVLNRITEWPIYCIDPLVRHATALQASMDQSSASIRINPALAKRLNLQESISVTVMQNHHSVTLPIVIDERIAMNQVWIPAGLEVTAGFGEAFGLVQIQVL